MNLCKQGFMPRVEFAVSLIQLMKRKILKKRILLASKFANENLKSSL